MSSPTTPPSPAETDSTPPSRRTRYWLGNAALIIGWLVGVTCLATAVGTGQLALLWVVMIPICLRTVMTIALLFRRRPVSDTVAILEGGMAITDERQRALNGKVMELSGLVAIAVFAVSIMFLGVAATKMGVTIVTEGDWMALATACMFHLLLTQNVVMVIAARVLSEKETSEDEDDLPSA